MDLLGVLEELVDELGAHCDVWEASDRELLDELEVLIPELGALCDRRWLLELLIKLCDQRSRR